MEGCSQILPWWTWPTGKAHTWNERHGEYDYTRASPAFIRFQWCATHTRYNTRVDPAAGPRPTILLTQTLNRMASPRDASTL
jgi:hypothetical protein